MFVNPRLTRFNKTMNISYCLDHLMGLFDDIFWQAWPVDCCTSIPSLIQRLKFLYECWLKPKKLVTSLLVAYSSPSIVGWWFALLVNPMVGYQMLPFCHSKLPGSFARPAVLCGMPDSPWRCPGSGSQRSWPACAALIGQDAESRGLRRPPRRPKEAYLTMC